MPDTPTPAGLPFPPDPPQDQAGQPVPEGIASFLAILRVLLPYAQHLAATLEHRAAARGFAVIARCFGTAKVGVILAHLTRGIRRAIALERVLLARAAAGRDVVVPSLRTRVPRPSQPVDAPAAAADLHAAGPAATEPALADPATNPAAALAVSRPARRRTRAAEPLDLAYIPSVEEFEAQIRRRPLARALADVCRDLGVAPNLCTGWFWNQVFETLTVYGGGFPAYTTEMFQRRRDFNAKELDRHPEMAWPDNTREDTRRAVGFFIGEAPVDPFTDPATGAVLARAVVTTGEVLAGIPGAGIPLASLASLGAPRTTFGTGPP